MIGTLKRQDSEIVDAEYQMIETTEEKRKKLIAEIVDKLRILDGYRDQAANVGGVQEWQPGPLQS